MEDEVKMSREEVEEMLDRQRKQALELAEIKEIAKQIAVNVASLLVNQQDYHRDINTTACFNYAGSIYRGILK